MKNYKITYMKTGYRRYIMYVSAESKEDVQEEKIEKNWSSYKIEEVI